MNLAPESVPPSCPRIKKREKKTHWHCKTFLFFLWHRFYCVGFSALTGYKSLLKPDPACQWADQCPWLGCVLGLLVERCVFCGVFLCFHWVIHPSIAREDFLRGVPTLNHVGTGVSVIPVWRFLVPTILW